MEPLEEGQIPDIPTLAAEDHSGYRTAYEWPGDDSPYLDDSMQEETFLSSLKPGQPIFRLVVSRSSILPTRQKVAMIDSYHEVQIGRDIQPVGSATPRIRLKEMEVSKLHATVYWDDARKEWSVVDMGSRHGTFLRSGSTPPYSEDVRIRLSQPRAASIPRRLRHQDQLVIGSTTFAVHIHDNQRPCQDCIVSGKEDLPLFPSPKKCPQKRTRDTAGLVSEESSASSSRTDAIERDPRKALSMLKRSLLTRHDGSSSGSNSAGSVGNSTEYVDRAARRRLLHPSSHPDSPGVPHIHAKLVTHDPLPSPSQEPPPRPVVSQPAPPLSASNVGHRLLMQLGWEPGNALGIPSDEQRGLIDPLEVKTIMNRTGLGMKTSEAARVDELDSFLVLNWKEQEKLKRFAAHKPH